MLDIIAHPVDDNHLGYIGFARVSVVMSGCQPVQPDFLFVRRDNNNVHLKRYVWGVPDLILEVLSPENATYDEQIKFAAYAAAGVPEYAMIDPVTRRLRYYSLKTLGEYREPQEFDSTQTMTFKCLPTIPLEVSKLFESAPDTTP